MAAERKSLKITPAALTGLTELARYHKCGTIVRPSISELCSQLATGVLRIHTPWSETRVCGLVAAFWRLREHGHIEEADAVLDLLRESPEVPESTQISLKSMQESGSAITEIGELVAQGRSFKVSKIDDSGGIATFLWQPSKI